mmetsp:Transcript_28437/g.71256  ORF Transcript_28437/g.71256 Transcript_28437/m.71256 type:complete len:352 (-) Transcript_28437:85-1140(-)
MRCGAGDRMGMTRARVPVPRGPRGAHCVARLGLEIGFHQLLLHLIVLVVRVQLRVELLLRERLGPGRLGTAPALAAAPTCSATLCARAPAAASLAHHLGNHLFAVAAVAIAAITVTAAVAVVASGRTTLVGDGATAATRSAVDSRGDGDPAREHHAAGGSRTGAAHELDLQRLPVELHSIVRLDGLHGILSASEDHLRRALGAALLVKVDAGLLDGPDLLEELLDVLVGDVEVQVGDDELGAAGGALGHAALICASRRRAAAPPASLVHVVLPAVIVKRGRHGPAAGGPAAGLGDHLGAHAWCFPRPAIVVASASSGLRGVAAAAAVPVVLGGGAGGARIFRSRRCLDHVV